MSDAPEPVDESFLIGGPEYRDIVLADYDRSWPDRFQQERARIEAALGSIAQQVAHIGSTAVPGLLAKPIIDILVTLQDVEDEARYLPALVKAGYLLRVREPGHRMLRAPELDVHVHVRPQDSAAARENRLFVLQRDDPVVRGSWPCAGMGVAETSAQKRTTSRERGYGLAA